MNEEMSGSSHNWLKKFGYGYLAVFILLSLYFYQERVIYIDSANQLFEMINHQGFEIFVGRYSMVFSQLLPLAAIKAGLSLRTIVVVYSLSFSLIYLLVYYICVEKLKNLAAGMLICITFISASHTFFHALSESLQVFCYSALLFAWLTKLKRESRHLSFRLSEVLITLFILALNFFIHPETLFLVAFIIGYVFFEDLIKLNKRVIGLVVFWVVLFAVKAIFFSKGSHDESFLSELSNTGNVLKNLRHIYPVIYVKNHFLQLFLVPFIMWCLLQYTWFKEKKHLWLGLYNLFLLGFLLLTLVIYSKGDSDHGMERSFLPFLLLVGLPFLNEILIPSLATRNLKSKVALLAGAGFMCIGLANIAIAAPIFSKRTAHLKQWINMVRYSRNDKFFIKSGNFNPKDLQVHYGTAVETMMLSSLDGPSTTKTIFLDQNVLDTIPNRFKEDDFYFTSYYVLRSTRILNPRYFRLSGIALELNPKKSLQESIYFDLETLSPSKKEFISDEGYRIKSTEGLVTDTAYSGNNSLKVGAGLEFGLEYKPKAHLGAKLTINVKRKGFRGSTLVLTDGGGFYTNVAAVKSINNEWEQLTIKQDLTAKIDVSNLKVYVWNPFAEPTYFDDLEIQIDYP